MALLPLSHHQNPTNFTHILVFSKGNVVIFGQSCFDLRKSLVNPVHHGPPILTSSLWTSNRPKILSNVIFWKRVLSRGKFLVRDHLCTFPFPFLASLAVLAFPGCTPNKARANKEEKRKGRTRGWERIRRKGVLCTHGSRFESSGSIM